jgi:hypothetical protein
MSLRAKSSIDKHIDDPSQLPGTPETLDRMDDLRAYADQLALEDGLANLRGLREMQEARDRYNRTPRKAA